MFSFLSDLTETSNISDAELDAFYQKVKNAIPEFKNLNNEGKKYFTIEAVKDIVKDAVRTRIEIAGINWNEEKTVFLNQLKSEQTKRVYKCSFTQFEDWSQQNKINKLTLSYKQADDYVYSLNSNPKRLSSAIIRLRISCLSSFYSFLNRRYEKVNNAFRGTKARPKRKNVKELLIPSQSEVDVIIANVPVRIAIAISIMAYRGLRVGALPSLKLYGGRYRGISKGKDLSENEVEGVTLPFKCEELISKAKLKASKLFEGITADTLSHNIVYHISKLYNAGKISHIYSCHDFRHFFAKTEYEKTKDIYRLSKLLNHTNISVTEAYLRSLNMALKPADADEPPLVECKSLMVIKK
jgi:site-specific recombinase XerD